MRSSEKSYVVTRLTGQCFLAVDRMTLLVRVSRVPEHGIALRLEILLTVSYEVQTTI